MVVPRFLNFGLVGSAYMQPVMSGTMSPVQSISPLLINRVDRYYFFIVSLLGKAEACFPLGFISFSFDFSL